MFMGFWDVCNPEMLYCTTWVGVVHCIICSMLGVLDMKAEYVMNDWSIISLSGCNGCKRTNLKVNLKLWPNHCWLPLFLHVETLRPIQLVMSHRLLINVIPSEFYFRACEFFLQSILNLRPCGTGYWLLTALQVPLALVLTLLSASYLHQPHKQAPPELQVLTFFSQLDLSCMYD